MKNILLGSIFALVLLPQMSFGATPSTGSTIPSTLPSSTSFADPALASFNAQQDAAAVAFFQKQAVDRGVFIKANPTIIGNEELRFKRERAMREARRTGASTTNLTPPGTQDPTFASFVAGQQAEKQAFFAQQAAAKQTFLNSQSSSSSSSTTTPPTGT